MGDESIEETVRPDAFELIIDATIAAGDEAEIELTSDQSVTPAQMGESEDQRPLALKVTRVLFEPEGSKARTPGGLPIHGPVHQQGKTEGYWFDQWVTSPLRFSVVADRDIRGVRLSGRLPEQRKEPRTITLRVGDRSSEKTFRRDAFDLTLDVDLRKGERREVEVNCDKSFTPSEEGTSQDVRHLAFFLQRIVFKA